MNKKILAAAIAASIAAPMAAAADVTVYGKMHASIDMIDGGGNVDYTDVTSRGSRLGFKGSEDLGNGLKANFQIETALDITDNYTGSAALLGGRNTYVGVSGDFGEIRVGHHDTPYKMVTGSMDNMTDQFGDINQLSGIEPIHAPDAVAYISPDFSGFHFAAAVVPGGDYGKTSPGDKDSFAAAYSIGAMYKNAGLTVIAGYEDLEDSAFNGGAATDDDTKWALGASYEMDAIKVAVVFEDHSLGANGANDVEAWYIPVTYTMGNTKLKAAWGSQDFDAAGTPSIDNWAVGVDHSLSKRTMVYVQYADYDKGVGNNMNGANPSATATSGTDGFQVGMAHSF